MVSNKKKKSQIRNREELGFGYAGDRSGRTVGKGLEQSRISCPVTKVLHLHYDRGLREPTVAIGRSVVLSPSSEWKRPSSQST